jgi:RNA polymerase sigma-70 factor (ECF subfamily)
VSKGKDSLPGEAFVSKGFSPGTDPAREERQRGKCAHRGHNPEEEEEGRKVMSSTSVREIRKEEPSSRPARDRSRKELGGLTDSEVVQAFLEGYGRAFGELVDRYDKRLLNFVYRTVGDRERAQDLVQETFVRVYRHLHRFDQTKKFSTWIYTIASNLAKNELRNRSRNPLVLFQTIKKNWEADHRPLEWEDTKLRPDDLFRKRHLRELVENSVEQLPEHHRLVFVLRELEGKTYEEIADITGCNLGTVKSRLNRARNNFARIIAPLLD